MPNSPKKKEYNAGYAQTHLKRIPLDVQKDKYDEIKAAADAAGEKVNTYIKKAIDERMERDGFATATPEPESTREQNPLPKAESQPISKSTGLPEYLTPNVLAHIDAKRFLTNDTAYQLEIGKIIGMEHISDLADYLRHQQTK